MRSFKAMLVGLASLVAFMVLAAPSSGSTITLNGYTFTATASQTLTLDPNGFAIACNISMGLRATSTSVTASSLPATIASLGSVTAIAGNCSGGYSLTFLNQPWRFDLVVDRGPGGVTATSRIVIKNLQFQFSGLWPCLFAGDVATGINAAGNQLIVDVGVPLASGSFICPSAFRLLGTMTLSPAIVFRLV